MTALAAITMASTGFSTPTLINIPVMNNGAPPHYEVGVICTMSSGATLSYSVQVTADASPSSSGNWNNSSLANLSASANGLIDYPITGVRVNVGTLSTGTLNVGLALWP